MDEISKRELLIETGISYGQLYRWKREGLIPEEWFVKRSAFTGQETWFPRERILERVGMILEMKDGQSLDEIRRQIAGSDDGELDALIRDAVATAAQDGAPTTAIFFETNERKHYILLTKDRRALSDNGVRVLSVLKEKEIRERVKAAVKAENEKMCMSAAAADADNEEIIVLVESADPENEEIIVIVETSDTENKEIQVIVETVDIESEEISESAESADTEKEEIIAPAETGDEAIEEICECVEAADTESEEICESVDAAGDAENDGGK